MSFLFGADMAGYKSGLDRFFGSLLVNMDPKLPASLTSFAARFGNVFKKRTSVVASPLSAQVVLALTALGSGGDTRAQLLQAMALPDDEAILSLFAYVTSSLNSGEGFSLKMANKVYLTNQGTLKPEIVNAANESFGPMLEQLNFRNNVGAASVVNKWVAKRTDSMIKDVVAPRLLSYDTRMLLINATYFQGIWEQPFTKSETRRRPFHVNNSTEVTVPMMFRSASYYQYKHSAQLNAHLLQMDYVGRQASMVLVVPDEVEGLGALLQQLAAGKDLMGELAGMRSTLLDVTIPKFRVHTELNLKDHLRKMGITSMFVDNNSDIQLLTSSERQYVSHAIQRTMVVVDEGGRDVRTGGLPSRLVKPPHKSSDRDVEIPWQVAIRRHKLQDSEIKLSSHESPDIAKSTQDLTVEETTHEQKSTNLNNPLELKMPDRDTNKSDEASDIEMKVAIEKTGIEKPNSKEMSGEQKSSSDIEVKSMEKTTGRETRERKTFDGDTDNSQPSGQNMTKTETPEHEGMLRDLVSGQNYVFYQNANGSFKLHRAPATWTDARLICYDEGAELASPESVSLLEAMAAVLLTSRQPPVHVFTGVNDLYSKGFFTSLRGTPLSEMPAQWAPREPDNVNHGANCLAMQRNGLLLDSKCDDVHPYICYKRQQMSQINLCDTIDTEYVFDRHTKTCHKFHPQSVSWQEAYATCDREGAYLAIMNDELEAKTLAGRTKSWAHIGISYWRKDLWMTIYGQTLSEAGFESWAPGEPNDVNEERCGCLSENGFLVDVDCEYHPLPFICEKSVLM